MNQTKSERKTHIDKANNLSILRQCELVEILVVVLLQGII